MAAASASAFSESSLSETSPLVGEPNVVPASPIRALEAVDDLRRKMKDSINVISTKFIAAKNRMKKPSLLMSLIVGLSSMCLTASGVVGLMTYTIRLQPIMAVVKVYQIIFAALCIATEGARYSNLLNFRKLIHQYIPLLELNLGRGLLQVLASGLALAGEWSLGDVIPGIALGAFGLIGVIEGTRTAITVNGLYKQLMVAAEEVGGSRAGKGLMFLNQKIAALDVHGDGKISMEEFKVGCRQLSINVDMEQIETIFTLLDPENKGFIGIDEFEQWYYSTLDEKRFDI